MAYLVNSKKFTQEEMQDGTAQTWVQTLTITTWHGMSQSQLGNATILLTLIYE